MKSSAKSQITDRSSRTLKAIFSDATEVIGHDYRSVKPGEIDRLNSQLITTIRNGGREGERAMNDLVKVNYLLVVSMAKNFSWASMDQMDLVQEGVLGVVEAVRYYDENEKQSFGAFAMAFIREKLRLAIVKLDKSVRLPENWFKMSYSYEQFSNDFYQKYEREPSADEFLEHEGMSTEGDCGCKNRAILRNIINSFSQTKSLDMTVRDEDGRKSVRLSEMMEGESNTEELAEKNSLRESLISKLDEVLNNTERQLVIEHFGLDGKDHSEGEIAWRYGLNRRQYLRLINQSISKLQQTVNK